MTRPGGFMRVLILIVALLAAWQGLYWVAGENAITSPWQTLLFILDFGRTDAFWASAWETLRVFLIALAVSVVLGLAIGFWLGFHRLSGAAMMPYLVGLSSVPKITLYPIVLLLFGLTVTSKVAFGALHGITPIALFTIGAVRNIRPVYLKLGRVSRLGSAQLVWHVLFPAALPEIFTGLRIGFALTLIGCVLAEMFASQRGLGFLLMQAIGLHNVPMLTAIAVILTVFAATFSGVLLAIDRHLHAKRT